MIRFALALFLAFTGAASAQGLWEPQKTPGGGGGGGGSCTGGYLGPGDTVASAASWWGLRAYNCAYASGSNFAITIRRASDNTTANVLILQTGVMDAVSAGTFCTATTCYVATFYDQSGNGLNAVQAT